ncbi:MAG: DegT/DnrJ/EryC1/StrS family aminotransferase [Acidobacteria bacterium]|nr:DegT/DnrJ/EryC1/StrS family aminotransferase [Acidobacteriota bacterium]
MIPFNDLNRTPAPLRAALAAGVQRVLDRGWFILGPECDAFEHEFAAYCGAAHCVSVANGTDALELALRALGIGPGDEVVTAANAGGYSSTAIRLAGAQPRYAEIDPATRNLSAAHLAGAITPRTRAVIATHLYGCMADVAALLEVTQRAGVPLIEDCAQAHGASIAGRKAGTWGAMGCFSFYPTKNLGACGDGGAVIASDAALARRVMSLRQYGWSRKYHSAETGRNSRMDEMQAAILRAKLPLLDGWNRRRREIAARYSAALAGSAVDCPRGFGDEYVAHLYVIRVARRDETREELKACGIATDVHYPVPDHLQEAASRAGAVPPALPETERAAGEVLTLPCYPELREEEIESIADALRALAERNRP